MVDKFVALPHFPGPQSFNSREECTHKEDGHWLHHWRYKIMLLWLKLCIHLDHHVHSGRQTYAPDRRPYLIQIYCFEWKQKNVFVEALSFLVFVISSKFSDICWKQSTYAESLSSSNYYQNFYTCVICYTVATRWSFYPLQSEKFYQILLKKRELDHLNDKNCKKIWVSFQFIQHAPRNFKQNMNERKFSYVYAYMLFFFLFYNGVVGLSGFYKYF